MPASTAAIMPSSSSDAWPRSRPDPARCSLVVIMAYDDPGTRVTTQHAGVTSRLPSRLSAVPRLRGLGTARVLPCTRDLSAADLDHDRKPWPPGRRPGRRDGVRRECRRGSHPVRVGLREIGSSRATRFRVSGYEGLGRVAAALPLTDLASSSQSAVPRSASHRQRPRALGMVVELAVPVTGKSTTTEIPADAESVEGPT